MILAPYVVSLSVAMMLFASHASCAEPATGVVCIDRINTKGSWEGNDTGAKRGSTFTVQIGDRVPVVIDSRSPGTVTGLSLAARHLIRIRLDGKPLTSFSFSFREKGTNHLRLWYYGMYGTWSIDSVEKPTDCQSVDS